MGFLIALLKSYRSPTQSPKWLRMHQVQTLLCIVLHNFLVADVGKFDGLSVIPHKCFPLAIVFTGTRSLRRTKYFPLFQQDQLHPFPPPLHPLLYHLLCPDLHSPKVPQVPQCLILFVMMDASDLGWRYQSFNQTSVSGSVDLCKAEASH